MTRVLLLAYHFPPIGGAGAQRNTKLARYLPSRGYELTVLTGPLAPGHRWTPTDESLLEEIPPQVEVHRVAGVEPPWSGGWRRRAERWLRLEWPWQRWWEEHAIPLATKIGRDADVVYAALSPFGIAGSAVAVARALDKPLVLDLEDPWALDEMMVYETGLHRRLELRAMRRALTAADAVVMNTPEAMARVRRAFPELADLPVTSILNGFDEADFAGPVETRAEGAFRIVHTGSLHGERGERPLVRRLLGGEVAPVYVRSRSLLYLLDALRNLFAARPDLRGRIELHLAGRLTPGDQALFEGLDFVREHGFLSHGETIGLIRSADLLFLPMHDVPANQRVAIVPCKTYEYLGSGRPILAAVPNGDARDLLAAAGTAQLVRPTDVAGLAAAVEEAVARYDRNEEPVASADLLKRVERQHLTDQVARVVDGLIGVPNSLEALEA
jgi:glycosyltransferase involved in cell wall biosynthesis